MTNSIDVKILVFADISSFEINSACFQIEGSTGLGEASTVESFYLHI